MNCVCGHEGRRVEIEDEDLACLVGEGDSFAVWTLNKDIRWNVEQILSTGTNM